MAANWEKDRRYAHLLDYINKVFVPLEKSTLFFAVFFCGSLSPAVCAAVLWGTLTPTLFVMGRRVAFSAASLTCCHVTGREGTLGGAYRFPPVITLFHTASVRASAMLAGRQCDRTSHRNARSRWRLVEAARPDPSAV